ncbi:microfibril-associated glycoprotein 4-like [Calliphora vicina]|uniref:microfibril-associated glycoprotein 4-like n=1 Tax=Calliphora vicina TaxID=7373 RepID=UPI00325BD9E0
MFFKYIFFLTFNFVILIQNGNGENCDWDAMYLHLFSQIENLKQSLEIQNTRLDIIAERHLNLNENKKIPEKPPKNSKSIFDVRFDAMPKHCATDVQPSSCAEATECTRRTGIYNITDTRYSNRTFTVYCDYDNYEGDWLYILRREDGNENFNRSWTDYVKGFGNPAREYWIGLENLYALTNYYGPQELNVYVENFEGVTKFARYDNFAIDSATEKYKLKTLSRYWGTAGDSMTRHLGQKFSTYDNDNDSICAKEREGGFWFAYCADANPTGKYLLGKYNGVLRGCYWNTFGGSFYSHKTIIFMIRRKTAAKLE